MRVLVTGATGYIGSQLVPALLEAGHEVHAGVRDLGDLADRPWVGQVERRLFDIEKPELIVSAIEGMEAVVYLVHSIDDEDFVRKDREAAEKVAASCAQHGVERIVYLSGLVPDGELSDHLRSRLEVEQVYLDSATPATVLRAAMVIGAGSTSFQILKRLTERVPVTPLPRWMLSSLQPVAIDDVVHLLVRSLDGAPRNRHYDVGGDEVMTYPQLLETFARVRGKRRVRFVLPFAPRPVVGRAIAQITGMDQPTVLALIDSLSHDMVAKEDQVRRDIADPDHTFTPIDRAFAVALEG